MRFLGIGKSCDLGSLYLRLIEDGHEVRAAVTEPLAAGTLAGLAPHVADWRGELDWVRAAGADGVILFESVAEGSGALQDSLRRAGLRVIGGSAFGDRLENDRAFAQTLLADFGLPTARTRQFDSAEAAERFLADNPGRYVLKFNGPDFYSHDNYVGMLADGRDMRAVLAARRAEIGAASFILMEHIDGIEMGVGAYFDGKEFLLPACLDWEHKRFFTGDMGELTGEMGTVATFERSGRFFERTLGRLAGVLRKGGYLGYINLNTIVNERGVFPLEFTCRFGYPGYATLEPLQDMRWGDLFRRMADGHGGPFLTRSGFSAAIVLTTPPFPYTRHQVAAPIGLPVIIEGEIDAADRANLHYGEVGLVDGELATSGLYGWTMVVTGTGETIADAKAAAYSRAARVRAPNLRYRLDIGDRLLAGDWTKLERLGVLDPA
jgi:phosphoribosylamine--glycine ligase